MLFARAAAATLACAPRAAACRLVTPPAARLAAAFSTTRQCATTILSVRKDNKGHMVLKPNARKVRRIGDDVIVGFAGSTADAMTLFERLEHKIEEHKGQLTRSCVELAKNWRTDKALRRLDATIIVCDARLSLTITGNGDVVEPQDGIVSVGSGSGYAIAAARALYDRPELTAGDIARRAMSIASDMCIYTNGEFVVEEVVEEDVAKKEEQQA